MSDIMAKDYPFPYETFAESAAPDTPASGKLVVYAKEDHKLYKKDSAGNEVEVGGAGATVATPAVSVYNSANQNVYTGQSNMLYFDTEQYDTDNMHSSADNSKLICKTPGKYLVSLYIRFSDNSTTGMREIELKKNGETFLMKIANFDGLRCRDNVAMVIELALNDYVQFSIYNNTGTTQTVTGGSDATTTKFQMTKIG